MPGNPTIDNLNPTFFQMLLGFVQASGGRVRLEGGSGWRSPEQQAAMYNAWLKGEYDAPRVASAEKSNHPKGLAFDLVYGPGGEAWAHANAARFGLRFPMDDEGWHVEPINIDALKTGSMTTTAGRAIVGASDMGFQQLTPEQARDRAKEIYGYLGWYVDHPEVGPIIVSAAMNGWDAAQLQGALSQTTWWRTTAESARMWDALKASDPAQAMQRAAETKLSLQVAAGKLGFPVPEDRLNQMSEDANRLGWSKEQLDLALAAELKWQPGQMTVGTLGNTMTQVHQIASEHMVPVNDQQAWEWARRIAAGAADLSSVTTQMQQLAIARFPQIADQINQGITPGQFFTPYRNLIGQLLDRSPDDIDLMSERWSPVVAMGSDSDLRPMTFGEATRFARTDPSWQRSPDGARVMGQYADTLSALFGTR